jgi:MOSC domain-containing protein YiiM
MMTDEQYRTLEELEAGLEHIRQSPKVDGSLALIVRRPGIDARETPQSGELSLTEGLVGDTWKDRPSSRMPDKSPHPDMQITIINARLIALLAREKERWPLAGDQLVADLDLSVENLPPGTRLAIGAAVLEVTDQPHTGCDKFAARFGRAALKWVNSPAGKQLRLRGLNSRVVQAGAIRVGDAVQKL